MGTGWAAGGAPGGRRRRRHRLHPQAFGEAELRSEVATLLQRQPALVEHPA